MPRRPDPLNASIQLKIKKGHDASVAKQQAVLRQWAETGELPMGYQVTGVTWTNPARKTAALRTPRHAGSRPEIEEARLTLGRFLRGRRFSPKSPPEARGSSRQRPDRRGD